MRLKTYLLRVLTPVHLGAGAGLGHIDLPTYREAHTDFPGIPASSIKGAVRTRAIIEKAEKSNMNPKDIDSMIEEYDPEKDSQDNDIRELAILFGSKNKEGSLVFTDARIMFFPVKSLRGIFAMVTCPFVLERFQEDTHISIVNNCPTPQKGECYVAKNSPVSFEIDGSRKVVLEEFLLEVKGEIGINLGCLNTKLVNRLVIVSDDLFTYMVKNYTEIQTHIRVDVEKGTVDEGALWTEEYVPAESIFYFGVSGGFGLPKCFQIGGNSSTGKGFVEVIPYENS